MRRIWLAVGVLVSVVTIQDSVGQAPGEIGQQGILTDSLGNPIVSGTFGLSFKLYSEEDGGTALWTETQSVSVDEGLYSVQLGEVNPIVLPFDEPYWLGISVDGGEELTPRLRFSAAPYARRATRVDSVDSEALLPSAVQAVHLADGAVTTSAINTEEAESGMVLVANDTSGLDWDYVEGVSIRDQSIITSKISPTGGSTGQVLTVEGDTVGWADPEEISGAALPNKSVLSSKLNSEGGAPGQVMLAAQSDSVIWGQLTGGGISDGTITTPKLSVDGASPGDVLTVDGGSAAWREPEGIAKGSIDYDRISTNGAAIGDVLAAAAGDTTAWVPVSIGTNQLKAGAVTPPKISQTGGQAGQVLSVGQSGVDWADVDPATFSVGSVALNKLKTTGASAGDYLIFDGAKPEWTEDPGLALPFFGQTAPSDSTSFQITSPISFTAQSPIDNAYAIHGVMSSTAGGPRATSVRGENRATSAFGIGVWGSHAGGGWGVYGSTPGGLAIYGSSLDGHAGFFDGKVTIIGTLQKSAGSFTIDHPLDPENKTLSHSFVESPDMMNIYNGTVFVESDGTATVTLPDWFDALNVDFRYQLTPIGGPGPNLHIADEIVGNSFRIGGGVPGMKVSWQVTGIRNDAYARANRIQVEEDKPIDERGRYLNPASFGLSRDRAVAPKQPDAQR